MDNRIAKRDQLIKEQKHLIGLFDSWVALVKADDLEAAKNVKDLANIVRGTVRSLEQEVKKADEDFKKRPLIITKLN